MTQARRPQTPLDPAALERLALRYVERFATSRGRLAAYLTRKLRERGWDGADAPDPQAVAQKMADRGYVDDRLFAESRAGSMARRGLGARRVREALRHDGIAEEDAAALEPALAEDAAASAIAFARRRRIGPYAREAADRPLQEKQLGQMLRAGHALDLARALVCMAPGDDAETMLILARNG